MTSPNDPMGEAALEELFREARQAAPEPSSALLARLAEDADAVQTALITPPDPIAPSLFQRAWTGLGGWAGLGGLATATVAGFYIGFAQPGLLTTPDLLSEEIADMEDWSSLWLGDTVLFEEG